MFEPREDPVLLAMQRVQRQLDEPHVIKEDSEPTEVLETINEAPAVVEPHVPPPPPLVTLANFLRHPDTHPLVLDLVLLRKYGPEWLSWEIETLERRMPEDFRVDSISALSLTKIQAVRALHFVDTYWQDWEIFLWCTMALNGLFPDFEVMQVPTVAQVLVSVDIANRIRDNMTWGDEIKIFIEQVYRHDCILTPLEPTTFITIEREEGLPGDFKEIAQRWPEVRSSEKPPKGETIEDEQLRRMLTAYTYLEESRARLRAQLPLVNHV